MYMYFLCSTLCQWSPVNFTHRSLDTKGNPLIAVSSIFLYFLKQPLSFFFISFVSWAKQIIFLRTDIFQYLIVIIINNNNH